MSTDSKVMYFIGCTTCYVYPETGKAMKKILEIAGIEVVIREDEPCCGGVLFMIGQTGEATKKVKENIAYFKGNNIGKIIVNCPECFKTFIYDYPRVDKTFNIKIQHNAQLIVELLKADKLHLTREVPIKATYHDSCHLGRYGGVYEEPRFIINSIPGIQFKEMELTKEHASCCGGPIREPFIELRNQMSLTNLDLAKRIKTIITACPTCYYNLDGVAQLFEHKVKVIELTNLVAYSTGLISELPGLKEAD
ncbi:MAG TPA: (Fe-S)-binding protein [Candidatus Deferrimicrobium sp.]|nr:(Fe-S)-binding protein [Candidatus Deferrimicrobium sp.]